MIRLFIKVLIILQAIIGHKPHVPPSTPVGLNCKNYHNGIFKITIYKKTTISKRYGNKQYDYYDGSKTPTSIFDVKWKDDCTCILKPSKEMIRINPSSKKHVLTVEIVQQNTNSVTQVVSANYTKAKTNCEVVKVK